MSNGELQRKKMFRQHNTVSSIASIKIMGAALIFSLLIASSILVSYAETSTASANDWPMFRHDLTNSGYSNSNGPLTNKTLWVFNAGVFVASSSAVSNGVVYAGTDGYIFALNASTGSVIWNYTANALIRSSPTIEGDTLYINSNDGNIIALNAATSQKIWNYTTGPWGSWDLSSPAVSNGMVFVGSYDGVVYALNAATGNKIWNYTVDKYTTINNTYNSTTGQYGTENFTAGCRIWSTPAISNGVVYVGSGYNVFNYETGVGYVYALDASTGTKIWNYTVNGCVDSSPAVVDGVVYVGSWDTYVYALNATTGSYMWRSGLGGRVSSSPAVANGVVYIGSFDRNVYALDAKVGDESTMPPVE